MAWDIAKGILIAILVVFLVRLVFTIPAIIRICRVAIYESKKGDKK